MTKTVEELEEELQETLTEIDKIAAKVAQKELDAYEGFMQTEKHKDKVVEIGHMLKEKGIDITTLTE
jgi:GTP-binding protein EngB required for normal cell division